MSFPKRRQISCTVEVLHTAVVTPRQLKHCCGYTESWETCLKYTPSNCRQNLTYVKKNGLEKEVVILVLELAVGGELFDFMMYTGAFPEIIARTYFLQVSLFS